MTYEQGEDMSKGHSYHIREKRWDLVKEKAWELSKKKGEMVKPTDLVDAAIHKAIASLTWEDVMRAKEDR